MAEYPYLRSNKNLPQIFEKIRTAAKPPKFTIAFVKQLGFTSSNDAAYPSLLKKLGYLMEDGTPSLDEIAKALLLPGIPISRR